MSATPNNCFHLTVQKMVREIHAEAIARFGGAEGVRDTALLESAVAAPQATFGGQSPYKHLAEVAAAYKSPPLQVTPPEMPTKPVLIAQVVPLAAPGCAAVKGWA